MADRDTNEDRPRCSAMTGRGQRCRNRALEGTTRCAHHTFKVPGRPRKITPELTERVMFTVLEGSYAEVAAQAAGIGKTTFYRWLRRADELEAQAREHMDDDDEDLYAHVDPADWPILDFRHAIKSAEAFSETELVRQTTGHAVVGGWQAFMTVLERRFPTRWGRRKVLDHTIKAEVESRTGPIEVIPDAAGARTVATILASSGAIAASAEHDELEED